MSAKRIYMDNAATSFPKPKAMHEAMMRFATEIGAGAGRGAYAEAREAGRLIAQCRQRINQLIGGQDPNHVIFTLNTTDGLNLAFRGLIRPGDHVITTEFDHNSVLRPFNALAAQIGATQTRIPCDPATGLVDPDAIRRAITPKTRLIAILHGSNVTGTLQPIREIGRLARQHEVLFLVDHAQTVGHVPVNVGDDFIDLLAFPGHKGLLGPLGTGTLYIRPGVEKLMRTWREGGTGSQSEQDTQPDFMPDRFEAGSHNAIGIVGLSEGVRWILDQTVAKLWAHEQDLCRVILEGLTETGSMPGLRCFGPQGIKDRCGVFSVRIDGFDEPQQLSDLLEREYGILTRSGLHCTPFAHQTIGTYTAHAASFASAASRGGTGGLSASGTLGSAASDGGTTRFSFGPFLSFQDVQYATDALGHICHTRTAAAV